MKDAFYFSHDSNARNDNKMLRLRCDMGWEGYGLFFAFLELMRDEENYMFPSNALATLEISLSIDKAKLEQFIKSCKNNGLLIDDGSFIYSESFLKRMSLMDEIREKRSKAGKKGGKAKAKLKQNPSNKRKRKEKKRKEKKDFKEPTLNEVSEYFNANGYSTDVGENAYHFYKEADWKDSNGKQVKNWKQKMRGVWFKPENLLENIEYQPMNSDGSSNGVAF